MPAAQGILVQKVRADHTLAVCIRDRSYSSYNIIIIVLTSDIVVHPLTVLNSAVKTG